MRENLRNFTKGIHMATNNFPGEDRRQEFDGRTYASVMKEIGSSTKELIQSEINLLMTEFKLVAKNVGKHTTQVVAFGSLLALSVLPFLAFLVIGLGILLEDRYWLSSLIVAVVCAAVGGPLAHRAFKKIKDEDIKIPHAKAALEKEVATVQRKFDDLKTTAKGDHHESH